MYERIPEEDAAMLRKARAGSLRLNKQQQKTLLARFRAGDQDAGDMLAQSVRFWVKSIVTRQAHGHGWADQEDERESAINLAITEAIQFFDPDKGQLTTFAYWRARAVCSRYLSFTRTVRVPASASETEATAGYAKKARHCLALDAPMRGLDKDQTMGECLPDKPFSSAELLDEQLERLQLRWALARMQPNWQRVLAGRFFDGDTLEDVAKTLDPPVTRERVRQIERLALKKLAELIKLAPTKEAELVDSEGRPLQLDGQLGDGRHVCDDQDVTPTVVYVKQQPAEEPVIATPAPMPSIRTILRRISVDDIDRELALMEEQVISSPHYHTDRKRLLALRAVLAPPPATLRPVEPKFVRGRGRLPEMFPRVGSAAETLHKALRDEGKATVTGLAKKLNMSVSAVSSTLERFRDRFFASDGNGKWQAIPRMQMRANWEAMYATTATAASA
jgi:RNA polymerase sigma factor (sigma-70 family)